MSQSFVPMAISDGNDEMSFSSQLTSNLPISSRQYGTFQGTRDHVLVKHPTFFQDSRVFVIQVENTLFRTALGPMLQSSDVLSGILSIPVSDTSEGTEENPFILEGYKVEEFAAFLSWAQHLVWDPPPYKESDLVNILSMCHRWSVKPGIKFAIHGLEQLNLAPARMLELALFFSIPQWIGPAVTKLLDMSILAHDDDQIIRFGQAFAYIAKAREMLMLERLRMGHFAPPVPEVPGLGCLGHEQCKATWSNVWFKQIARDLLHPISPLKFDDAISHITATNFPGMTDSCKETTLVALILSDKFGVQRRVADSTTAAIIKAYHF